MAIYVKSHRRGNAIVAAHSRARKGLAFTTPYQPAKKPRRVKSKDRQDRMEELVRRYGNKSALINMSGERDTKKGKTLNRLYEKAVRLYNLK